MSQRTLIFTATYNERVNIELLIERIFSLDTGYEILVVDDNSPDGTGILLSHLAEKNPRLHVVHRPSKLGLGTAHLLAMLFAIKSGYDRLVTMDADLSHDPCEIPALLSALDTADFVIGSRYVEGGSSDYRGYRKFISITANTLARTLLRIPLREFTTSFRAFRVSMLRSRRCAKLKSEGYTFFMETVYRLHRAGYRIVEVPIQFKDRHSGVSKIPRLEVLNGIIRLFYLTLSSWFSRGEFLPATEVEDRCYACESPYTIEIFPPRRPHTSDASTELFRCSSMAHDSSPQVIRCLQCGLMHVPASKVPTQLESLYANVEDEGYLSNTQARKINFSRTFDRLLPFLQNPPGRLLEVGAYCGLFMAEASRRGWRADGVEPSRWAVHAAMANFGIAIHEGSYVTASAKLSPPYDVVASWDVLEHLRDPLDFLRWSNTQLSSGGILCLSTLDAASPYARMLGARWPWLMDMHLFYFDRLLLKRWLEGAGFEVLEMSDYTHYATGSYLLKKVAALLPKIFSPIMAALARILPSRFVLPIRLGDTVLAIARKTRAASSLPVDTTGVSLDNIPPQTSG